MASLWRLLAVAWLGGVAPPALMEDSAWPDVRIESRAHRSSAAREDMRDIGKGERVRVIRDRYQTMD